MKEAILMTLTLLAFGCTQEGTGPDRDALGHGDDPQGEIADASCASLPCGDCNEVVCHEYGGGIEECVCADDGQAALDLGPPLEPDPDPYAD